MSSLLYEPTGFVCNLQQKEITFLYRITLLVFIMETGVFTVWHNLGLLSMFSLILIFKRLSTKKNCLYHETIQNSNFSEVHKSTVWVLTAFEKDKQQIERSNSPIPMIASVWRLTEFHTRTWGCKNPNESKITISAAERNAIIIILHCVST